MMKEIKDSGSRREFDTGAVRDNGNTEDKGRFDLIPWEVIWDLAKHFAKGSAKYGDNNWQKGIPVDSYFDSAMRHMIKHRLGHEDEDHLTSALWNLVSWSWEERYSPRAKMIDTSKAEEFTFTIDATNLNSLIKPMNDEVEEKNDGIKHVHINKLREPFGYCDECHISSKLYAHPSGKKLCAKCWNKEEDDLK